MLYQGVSRIAHKEKQRLELLQERLEYLRITLVDFDSMRDNSARNSSRQWHYFPDRLLVGDCNSVFQNVNKSLEYHIDWLDEFIPTVGGMVDEVNAVVFVNMTSLRSNMVSLSKCLTSYKEELDSFQDYLNMVSTTTSHNDFTYEPPVAILSSFQSGGRWLDSISTRYIANEYSKKELVQKVESKVESRVTTPVSRLYSDIQLSLLSEVREHIEKQERIMVSFYGNLLRRVTSLQRYMFSNDTSLEQFMRRVSIWRMPTFTIQNSQVLIAFSRVSIVLFYTPVHTATVLPKTATKSSKTATSCSRKRQQSRRFDNKLSPFLATTDTCMLQFRATMLPFRRL